MGGPATQQPEIIPEQYRAQRLGGLFTQDPALQALLASVVGAMGPLGPNVMGQAFRGAGGQPALDLGVLPPELQAAGATPPGATPNTGTLPPAVQAQATSAAPAPAGSPVPVNPVVAAMIAAMSRPNARTAGPTGPSGQAPRSEKGGEERAAPQFEAGTGGTGGAA